MGLLDSWVKKSKNALKDKLGLKSKSVSSGNSSGTGTTDPTITGARRDYLVTIKQNQDIPKGEGMVVVGQIAQDFQIEQAVKWATPWGAGLIGEGNIADLMAVTTGNRLVAQTLTLQVWQGAGNDIDFTVSFELRAWSSTERDVMIPLRYLLSMSMPSMNDAGFLLSPGPLLDSEALKELGQAIPKAISVATEVGTEYFKELGQAAVNTATSKTTGKTQDGSQKAIGLGDEGPAAKKAKSTIGVLAKKETIERLMKNKISISIGSWFELSNIVITNVQHTLKPQMPGPDGGLMAADVTINFRPMFALTTADIKSILKEPKSKGGAK